LGTAKTQSKDKYNEREYARYTLRVRKDSQLYDDILEYTSRRGTSLNGLIVKLLKHEFEYSDNDTNLKRHVERVENFKRKSGHVE
jgi:hypothetical protein